MHKLGEFDQRNKINLEADFFKEQVGTVKSYVEHHLDVINKEKLATIIDFENKNLAPGTQMLNSLQLVRIRVAPEKKENYAVFDYSIGRGLSNYLVVVYIDDQGALCYLGMES